LLRPLEHDGEQATLPFEATWRALGVLRLAVLDRRWSVRMCQYPDVGIALCARALLRSRRLANTLVIASHPRLDERLWLLLWEFADRYGTVHGDGVHLQLPLTHEVLAEPAAARRPSVSTALSRLVRSGQIERRDGLWVLYGKPPRHGGDRRGSRLGRAPAARLNGLPVRQLDVAHHRLCAAANERAARPPVGEAALAVCTAEWPAAPGSITHHWQWRDHACSSTARRPSSGVVVPAVVAACAEPSTPRSSSSCVRPSAPGRG
jgi:hypothetical protein